LLAFEVAALHNRLVAVPIRLYDFVVPLVGACVSSGVAAAAFVVHSGSAFEAVDRPFDSGP
jgi:hypothetical protein